LTTFFFTAIDGTKSATGKIYNRFRIEGDPDSDRILRANVSGDVSWAGRLFIEAGSGRINASVKVWVKLLDETDNNRTIAEQEMVYSDCDISAVFPTACLKFPQGSSAYNFAADLQRGHTYRLEFAARCRSDIKFPAAVAGVGCSFSDDGLAPNGISRSEFRVNIERDLLEEIEQLREELYELRDQYDSHSHVYRTGRGKGHNNTKKISSSPVDSD